MMELGPEYNLPRNTPVTVTISGITFQGKIVGKATTDLTQSHIVKCVDGTFPNDDYPHDTIVVPIALVEVNE